MLPKTRSSNHTNASGTKPTGIQRPLDTMAAKSNKAASDPQLPEDESHHKLLLNNVANQKASDVKQVKRHQELDIATTIGQAHTGNSEALFAIKGNVTTNAADILNLQASVTKLQTELSLMQSKYEFVCCFNLQIEQ